MPISLLPDDRRLWWLKCDADIALDKRPVFVCNSPTRKTMLEWSRLYDEAVKIAKGPEAFAKLHEMIKLGVKDWKNFPDPFSEDALNKLLSNNELEELAYGWPDAFKLTEEQRTGFTLPQPSIAENSADSAKADATHSPPPNSPSTSKLSSVYVQTDVTGVVEAAA